MTIIIWYLIGVILSYALAAIWNDLLYNKLNDSELKIFTKAKLQVVVFSWIYIVLFLIIVIICIGLSRLINLGFDFFTKESFLPTFKFKK